MRHALAILIFIIGMTTLGVKPAPAQINQNLRAWWAGGEIGEGQLSLSSDQVHRDRTPTFALGIFGGHRLGDQARVGLEMNGWLLQASNLNDPTVGESVSNVLGVIDVFPTRKIPLFIRGGGSGRTTRVSAGRERSCDFAAWHHCIAERRCLVAGLRASQRTSRLCSIYYQKRGNNRNGHLIHRGATVEKRARPRAEGSPTFKRCTGGTGQR